MKHPPPNDRHLMKFVGWFLVMFGYISMVGCASGTAKGGDTQMERSTEKPSTRTYRYETFGRDPTPAEIAAFAGWTAPKPEVKK